MRERIDQSAVSRSNGVGDIDGASEQTAGERPNPRITSSKTDCTPQLDIPADPLGWLPVSFGALRAPDRYAAHNEYKILLTGRIAVQRHDDGLTRVLPGWGGR
jgi:hypothetical protein